METGLPDRDTAVTESIRREMTIDLARRVAHGFYAYAMLLIVLWTNTTIPAEHPRVWWIFAAWLIIGNLARAYLVVRRETLYDRAPILFPIVLKSTTATVSAALGGFLILNAIWYSLDQ